MEINKETIEAYLNKYTPWVEKLSISYNYPENIKHLLTLITTSFVLKYGYKKESIILNCLEETPIIIKDIQEKRIQASFVRTIKNDKTEIKVIKGILLNYYKDISLMQLLENLIHEYNHAINSYEKELSVIEDKLFLRTGLSNIIYNRNNLTIFNKEDTYILEEIINTKQTEDIMNLIHSFSEHTFTMTEINHTLYSIKYSFENKYHSTAYLWHTYACKILLENRTFSSTLENLRLTGNIEVIPTWFNDIYGHPDAYKNLVDLLSKLTILEQLEYKKKGFAFLRKKRQRIVFEQLNKISTKFNDNCILK